MFGTVPGARYQMHVCPDHKLSNQGLYLANVTYKPTLRYCEDWSSGPVTVSSR